MEGISGGHRAGQRAIGNQLIDDCCLTLNRAVLIYIILEVLVWDDTSLAWGAITAP